MVSSLTHQEGEMQCECGCGGEVKPGRRYLSGHNMRGKSSSDHPRWRGGRYVHKGGYVYVHAPDHPLANADGYVYEHRLVAETRLGRHLTPRERVHHINGDKTDNRPENLVVLTSQAEHVNLPGHGAEVLRRSHEGKTREWYQERGRMGAEAKWRGRPTS